MAKANSRIFVVDDDKAVRDALKFALELEGFCVHACAGGAELFAHRELPNAACIVVDRIMPDMDGFAVIEGLAALTNPAPVILIVSELTPAVRGRAARAGVTHILEKPLAGNSLPDIIHKAIREAHA